MRAAQTRSTSKLLVLGLLAVVTSCTRETDPDAPQSLAPLPPGPPAKVHDPHRDSIARFGEVHLHAGFSPDPRVIEGRAHGRAEASAIDRRCAGWISEQPDYLVLADTALLKLYMLGRALGPIFLVLRKPDGTVVCKRKAVPDPVLRTRLPRGASQLWVGVPTEGGETSYRIGFSELSWKSSALALPGAH